MRRVLLLLHRYTGLVLAGFLVLAALTGSVLAWYQELDSAANAAVTRVAPPSPDSRPLDPLDLRERFLAARPGTEVNYVELDARPDRAVSFYAENSAPGADNEFWLDPYTGEVRGSRNWGDLGQGLANLFPFIYRLHYALALGDAGVLLLGVIGLLWTLDCFVGAALTFPRRAAAPSSTPGPRGWFSRWAPAWLVRFGGDRFRFVFTFHRAAGLWLWAMLFIFAWSAVGFNLRPVYHPVMKTLFAHQTEVETIPELSAPRMQPKLSWHDARETARTLITREAAARGFTVLREKTLSYNPDTGAFRYDVQSDRDLSDHRGRTLLYFDGNTGSRLALHLPTGEAPGDTLDTWLFALHLGQVGGIPYRIFITMLGLAVSALSITGVLIYVRKVRARTQITLSR